SVVESSLRMADVLKLNTDELGVMSRFFGLQGDAPSKLRRLAARFDLRAAALTRGPAGCVLIAGGRTSVHPGHPARVVDTVGAGDAFAAVLTLGLLEGHDLDSIADRANRVAAFVCGRVGATPAVPPDIAGGSPGRAV
ncbi:MAG: PfkB family carbohydrate kinase, partial [bacterium]